MNKIQGGQVLLTGGSGFIGNYVIEALKDKFEIVVVDKVKPNSEVKYFHLDVKKPFSISNDFDVCIHLAGFVGGIQYFTKHPVENIRDNPNMTGNVLDACVDSSIKQVIYASSSVIYQYQKKFPYLEEDADTSPPPSSAYGLSKLVGEYFCKAYQEQFGLNYTVLRPFNAYGPKEVPDLEYAHVIPHLIRKVLSGQCPIEIYGSGKQKRTFTHGKDIARAFLMCIKNKKAMNEIFNVSGNNEIQIIQVLKKIWELTGHNKKLKVKHLPSFQDDVMRRFPSNKKIRQKLKWKPEIQFEDGLSETIDWIKNYSFNDR